MPQPSMAEWNLVGSIYDAAVNANLWPGVMANVAALCDADKVMMAVTDALNPKWNLEITHNFSAGDLQRYRDEGYDQAELAVLGAWLSQVGLGIASCSDDYFGGAQGYLAAGGEYTAMLARNGVRRQVMVLFEQSDFRVAGLGLNKWDPFPEHSAPTLGRLSPHFRRALEIHRQLAAKRLENSRLYTLLDSLTVGVILLDGAQHVRYANTSAVYQLQQHGGVSVRKSQLLPSDAAIAKQLQQLLNDAVRTSQRELPAASAGGVLGIPSARGNALTFSVVPLSHLGGWQELHSEQIAAAIFTSEANGTYHISRQALIDIYKLTPREAQICQAYINLPSLEALAPQLGITLGSLRTMMKSVYQKTGCISQAKLMRLLMEMKENFRHL